MEDPDEVWRQARALNAAWDRILDRLAAGELGSEEGAAEVRAPLAAPPPEVPAMASRFARPKNDLRRGREGR